MLRAAREDYICANQMIKETTKIKIEIIYATRGDLKGEIDLQWEPAADSRYYVLEMCLDGRSNSAWKTIDLTTKSNYKVSGLRSNAHYRFRVAGVNTNEQSDWSREISISAP